MIAECLVLPAVPDPSGSWRAALGRGGYEVEGAKAAWVAARPDSNAAWSRRPSVARRLTAGEPAGGRIENTPALARDALREGAAAGQPAAGSGAFSEGVA